MLCYNYVMLYNIKIIHFITILAIHWHGELSPETKQGKHSTRITFTVLP